MCASHESSGNVLEVTAHSSCTSGQSPSRVAETPLSLLRTCINLGLCQLSLLQQSPGAVLTGQFPHMKFSAARRTLPPITPSQSLVHCPDWCRAPGIWQSSVLLDPIGPVNPAEGKVLSQTSALQNARTSIQTISSEGKLLDPKLALN